MNRTLVILAWIFFAVFSIAVIRYMDGFYDRADLKDAQSIVINSRPLGPERPTLLELMATYYGRPASEVACSYQVHSSSEGTVLVKCVHVSPKCSDEKSQDCHIEEVQPSPSLHASFEWMIHRLTSQITAHNDTAQNLVFAQDKNISSSP